MEEARSSHAPQVSVVIPVRNEVDAIGSAVASALDQSEVASLEVVVADGASNDGTRALVSALAHDDSRVRLINNPAGTTPAGLNAAIAGSRGDVIVRCDAHSDLPKHYVQFALEALDESGADVVGGRQNAVGRRLLQRAIAIAMTTPLGVGDARFHIGGPAGPVDTVYLGVFRRSALERVGLFDESLERNQDYELNHRIRQSGGTVFFDPRLSVDYSPRASLGALARQYHQYGKWKRLVLARSPESLRWRQLAAPLLVVGLVISLILLGFGQRLAAAIVPGAYLLGIAGTTIFEAMRRRDIAALALPVVLPTMHLSWALGFMASDIDDPGPKIPRLEPQ